VLSFRSGCAPYYTSNVFKRALGPTHQEALLNYLGAALEWAGLRANPERQAGVEQEPPTTDLPVTYKSLTTRELKLIDHFVDSWEYRSLQSHRPDVRDLSDKELEEHEADLKVPQTDLRMSLRRLSPPDWWLAEIEKQLVYPNAMRLHANCPDRRGFSFA